MSPVTALNFALVGCALLLLETNRGILPGQYLAIGAAIPSLIALVGYAYGEESLYSVSGYTSTAVHTAVTFLVLCFGIFYAYPARGLMGIVTGENTGSALVRRLLPFAILAPLVGGWWQIKGQDAGLYGTGFGTALFAVTLMLIFVAVIGWTARSLSQSDEKRRRAEESLRRARDELEGRVQERTAEIVKKTRDLETLLYVVSHDLREPLRSIENFSRLVHDRYAAHLDEKGQDFLRRVVRGVQRMDRLMTDILALSRAQRMELPVEEVEGESIVREALRQLEDKVKETGATVRVAKDLPRLRGNRT
jgi:signal transduction histidine kinase